MPDLGVPALSFVNYIVVEVLQVNCPQADEAGGSKLNKNNNIAILYSRYESVLSTRMYALNRTLLFRRFCYRC